MPTLQNYAVNVNITFIGPSPESIIKMGTKDVARDTMEAADVPIVPGSKGIIASIEEGVEFAK